jgi:CheY-like chemotaxis protein
MAEHPLRRVLVIDDDQLMCDLLKRLLTLEGYCVDCANSGDEALRRFRSPDLAPNAVLTDLQMPGLTGPGLATRMRAAWGEIRILAMSGADVGPEMLTGFNGFLRKPFPISMLNRLLMDHPPIPAKLENSQDQAQILEKEVYLQLEEAMGQQKLAKLYSLCIEDTRKRIERMQQAVDQLDHATYLRQAHAIKGSCGMLGALELQALAEEIEGAGSMVEPAAKLESLLQACNRLEGMLFQDRLTTANDMTSETARRSHA